MHDNKSALGFQTFSLTQFDKIISKNILNSQHLFVNPTKNPMTACNKYSGELNTPLCS